jgi:hypothetical protein
MAARERAHTLCFSNASDSPLSTRENHRNRNKEKKSDLRIADPTIRSLEAGEFCVRQTPTYQTTGEVA